MAAYIGELGRRQGDISSLDLSGTHCVLHAYAPLAELSGFSARIRSLSSGLASITLKLADYQPVNKHRQEQLMSRFHPTKY